MKRMTGWMMVGALGLAMLVSTSAMAGGRDHGRYDRGRDHGRFDKRYDNRHDSRYDSRFDNRRVIVVGGPKFVKPMPAPVRYSSGYTTTYRPAAVCPTYTTTRYVTVCEPRTVITRTIVTPRVGVTIVVGR
ncbi:MAG: hypothetical protein FWE88_05210 [Phycisphaerae bacterium]|nr:hypothetical protein [Phycisphaerae bacterium]